MKSNALEKSIAIKSTLLLLSISCVTSFSSSNKLEVVDYSCLKPRCELLNSLCLSQCVMIFSCTIDSMTLQIFEVRLIDL